jgi:hypothetical protein
MSGWKYFSTENALVRLRAKQFLRRCTRTVSLRLETHARTIPAAFTAAWGPVLIALSPWMGAKVLEHAWKRCKLVSKCAPACPKAQQQIR